MKRPHLLLVLVLGLATLSNNATGQEVGVDPALMEHSQQFAKAINEANTESVMALFHPDAVFIDEAQQRYQGAEQIKGLFATFFETYPNAKLQLDSEEIQPIGDDLALKEGRRVVTTEDGGMAVVRFNTLLRKIDGKWLIITVKEQAAEDELVPGVRLEPLGWLAGDWVNEGADSKVDISCKWSDDGNYLLIDYRVVADGDTVLNSHQRIGWDPQAKKIRSWLFDSDGGFGEGYWTLLDDKWVVKSTAVLPDGVTGSATFVYAPESEDKIVLYGLDRVVGEELADDFEVTLVRQPPKPAAR